MLKVATSAYSPLLPEAENSRQVSPHSWKLLTPPNQGNLPAHPTLSLVGGMGLDRASVCSSAQSCGEGPTQGKVQCQPKVITNLRPTGVPSLRYSEGGDLIQREQLNCGTSWLQDGTSCSSSSQGNTTLH